MRSLLLRLRKDYRPNKPYYRMLKETFGLVPHNVELYKLALLHRSVSQPGEEGHGLVNNERLEYLGDAILEAIVSDYLFIEFPDRNEGFLTQLRSKIVSRASLNEIAVKIGLDRHVIVQHNSNHVQKHLYGDALEAMIGAIYLDKGYEYVNRLVINDILTKNLRLDQLTAQETDHKSRLIEWGQKNRLKIVFETVPAPERGQGFLCGVTVGGVFLGSGEGDSKKEAEQQASAASLTALRKDKALRERLRTSDEILP